MGQRKARRGKKNVLDHVPEDQIKIGGTDHRKAFTGYKEQVGKLNLSPRFSWGKGSHKKGLRAKRGGQRTEKPGLASCHVRDFGGGGWEKSTSS